MGLTEKEIGAVAIATAMSSASKKLEETIEEFAEKYLSEMELKGAKIAYAIMSMTNVYYRFFIWLITRNTNGCLLNCKEPAKINQELIKKLSNWQFLVSWRLTTAKFVLTFMNSAYAVWG